MKKCPVDISKVRHSESAEQNTFGFKIFFPSKQGLRRFGESDFLTVLGSQIPYPIKTRIKTRLVHPHRASHRQLRYHIPSKQGLRQISIFTVSRLYRCLRYHIPSEQGLRLVLSRSFQTVFLDLRYHIPSKQGLRHIYNALPSADIFCQLRYHIPSKQGLRRHRYGYTFY